MFLGHCQRLTTSISRQITRYHQFGCHSHVFRAKHACRRVGRLPVVFELRQIHNNSCSHNAHEIPQPTPPVQQTWVDRLPTSVRPYLYLTRIDKPIGTLLLYYPCSESFHRCLHANQNEHIFSSMVHCHGLIRVARAHHNSIEVPGAVRYWSIDHARCGLYNQRHVGSQPRQGCG